LKVLSDRERLGSTGIGDGVAIPHGTMSSLNHLVALFGRSVEGVEFDAIDGKRTHLFFVILTPDNNVGLQALARVSRMMREPRFRQVLLEAAGQEELYRAIAAEDERL
jgi:PTS system nitrogen regulatory IIA component